MNCQIWLNRPIQIFALFWFQVGIYLPQPMSDHGKLYVAMSRVRRQQDLRMLVIDDAMELQGKDRKTGAWFTRNIVIKQLIDFEQTQLPAVPRSQRQPPPTAHLESSVSLFAIPVELAT